MDVVTASTKKASSAGEVGKSSIASSGDMPATLEVTTGLMALVAVK
jgi:hypothetical protein